MNRLSNFWLDEEVSRGKVPLQLYADMGMNELTDILDTLIDNWCERRALRPLRILLPAWPMPMGLTDEWEELRPALRHVRAMCSNELPEDETQKLNRAIALIDRALTRND